MKLILKKAWQYPIVLIWFIISILFFEYFLNTGNTDLAKDMSQASLPVFVVRYDDHDYNRLFGYTKEMDYSYIRDGITPLEEGRKLNARLYKEGSRIEKISYKLRSIDKDRFIEEGEITGYKETGEYVDLAFSFRDLINEKTEYSLMIDVTLASEKHAYYYARVIQDDELNFSEKLEFVYHFNECTFDKDLADQELTVYMESNSSGDNTNFEHVNIHSSMDQLTWGKLSVSKKTEPVCTVEEIDSKNASMKLEYMVTTASDAENRSKNYVVTEYYRFIKGKERMYLLDFDRYMDTIIFADDGVVYNDKLMLGITKDDFESMESEEGNTYAFVNNNSLFIVNSKNNRFQTAYSFYNKDNFDARCLNPSHDIKILNVDDSDNVLFCVYGYFNRGDHEGECGINILQYDAARNVVTEIVFIDSDKPYEIMRHDAEKLAFYDSVNNFYFYLDNKLYKGFVDSYETQVVVDNLKNDMLYVSPSESNIAWQKNDSNNGNGKITFMRLKDGYEYSLETFGNNSLKALGFMGEDLIYGRVLEEDVYKDEFGDKVYPMYEVNIINNKNEIIKNYQKDGIYILSCKINDNLITLTRIERNDDGEFISAAPDSIVNNSMEKTTKNNVEIVATENMKKIVQIALKNEMDNKKTKFQNPKTELFEGSRDIVVDSKSDEDTSFYAFKGKKCLGKFTEATDAIKIAKDANGCVVDSLGHYIWKKESYRNVNQIMKIDGGNTADDENSSLEECIETILEYEGYPLNIKDSLLRGEKSEDILNKNIPSSRAFEIKNCDDDTIKYYLNKDIPVIAMADSNTVLIVGYSDSVYVWFNPQTGNLMKVSVDEADKFYAKYGYRFVTYVKWDS